MLGYEYDYDIGTLDSTSWLAISSSQFLRATAVPAGTAEARISYGDSVCLSVCLPVRHNPVPNQAQVR